MTEKFKLTYATMFNPPEELHNKYDAAIEKTRANLGKEYAMIINGKDVFAEKRFEDFSPINTEWVLAVMQKGDENHARQALEAARKAFPVWAKTPWQKRIELLRKAADLIDERIFELGAAMTLEVGKNRMESLGDVAETADLVRYSCYQMEKNDGYIVRNGQRPTGWFQFHQYLCAPSLRRMACDQSLQLPYRFDRRPSRRSPGQRQHSGNETRHRHTLDCAIAGRMFPRCWFARWRSQLRHRPRSYLRSGLD